MSIISGANAVTGAGAVSYQIESSLRFNSADSAYLSRTPASASNRKTWTWSGWVKRSQLGAVQGLFDAYVGGLDFVTAFFNSNDTIYFYTCSNIGSFVDYDFTTTAVFRDVSAWYHIVIVLDTSNATQANRFIVYVNGVRQAGTNPSGAFDLNVETYINSTAAHRIGSRTDGSYYSNQYMTEVNFIDGQALDPTSFGEYNTDTGVWQPKAYTGSYGTNGFYLNFSDNSGTTSTTLGKDYSGNGNNWTPNNFSVTAGSGNDSLVDVPTNYGTDTGAGGEVRGNYATFNPLAVTAANSTLSNGNLQVVTPSVGGNAFATMGIPASGKWYFEITPTSGAANGMVGVSAYTVGSTYLWQNSNHVLYYSNGQKYVDGSASAYGATFTDNDVIGVACDSNAGTITFYKNGSSQGSISHTMTDMFPAVTDGSSGSGTTFQANFGQRPFAYTAPSGFKALCTQNLPEPTVVDGGEYFNAVLWTGNSSASQAVTGVGFQPDLVWAKSRPANSGQDWVDSVRGATKNLQSSSTAAETTSNTVISFQSDGFTVGDGLGYDINKSGESVVGWCWKAGGTGVTNTAGTITSTVSANTTAGFSIVTYTGTGSGTPTVGHGLGVAPSMIFIKSRSNVINWGVGHISAGWSNAALLNATNSFGGSSYFASTAPTSTVFSIQDTSVTNIGGATYVAYCFAPVSGYSAFGSFSTNGSSDGPFIYTGFTPRWILMKYSNTTSYWLVMDTARNTYNVTNAGLRPNTTDAESTALFAIDIVSNGFKPRDGGGLNGAGNTTIYAAFAENPFKYSLAR